MQRKTKYIGKNPQKKNKTYKTQEHKNQNHFTLLARNYGNWNRVQQPSFEFPQNIALGKYVAYG